MTSSLLDYDPSDTGEIPPVDDLGLEATRDLSARRRDTTEEHTENLAHHIAGLPPRRRPASDATAHIRLVDVPLGLSSGDLAAAVHPRVIEIDDTVTFGLAGPQSPPPPLPKPPPSKRLSLGDSVAGLDGELHQAPLPKPEQDAHVLRRSVPYTIPADARSWSGARHAKPSPLWARLAVAVGGVMAVGAFAAGIVLLAVAL